MTSQLSRLASIVDQLERRGGMYLQPFNYHTLVAFLLGYDLASMESGLPGNFEAFTTWLHKRVGHHCSSAWHAVVRDLFAEGDEAKAIHVLIRLLKDFVKESLSK